MLTFGHDLEKMEYHVCDGGELAALVRYRRDTNLITIEHTETLPNFQGQGLASRLMEFVLTEIKTNAWHVRAECSYAQSWLARHPEFSDLIRDHEPQGWGPSVD